MEKQKLMKDGSVGYLTSSERYYARKEPEFDNWTRIEYYTLEGMYINLPSGTCISCGQTIQSKHCGDFVMCGCGGCYVDTDRWMPEKGRYGGNLANLA